MSRRPIRIPRAGRPQFDIFSAGRAGPQASGGFSRAQIEQIARTVRRVPEVMVKVTGGGTRIGAVAAHVAYISRDGELTMETDEGEHIEGQDAQKELLRDWHLELSAGQYRRHGGKKTARRPVKLVHNIVLSMPAPTPPKKVLAAAKKFAREKFGAQHRYMMALHTDQQHPHVHLVVKAESEYGRRLHIDKPMLREWREDFAKLMREQGVAANATRGCPRPEQRPEPRPDLPCAASRCLERASGTRHGGCGRTHTNRIDHGSGPRQAAGNPEDGSSELDEDGGGARRARGSGPGRRSAPIRESHACGADR
jgi:hypothetical protein